MLICLKIPEIVTMVNLILQFLKKPSVISDFAFPLAHKYLALELIIHVMFFCILIDYNHN